ncbi:hypothetical protein FHG87_012282, partial [Trinorchestia longiramus]
RYAVRLLTPAAVLGRQAGRTTIAPEDVATAAELFIDAKTSAQVLAENSAKYMK